MCTYDRCMPYSVHDNATHSHFIKRIFDVLVFSNESQQLKRDITTSVYLTTTNLMSESTVK